MEENIPEAKWLWINYFDGHKEYRKAQKRNSAWAKKLGFTTREYNRKSIDPTFAKKHKAILKQPLGCGSYLWKPYIIHHAFSTLKEGDYLVFCDSGSKFRFGGKNSLGEHLDQWGIASIDHPRPQYQVTKRDAYILMDLDKKEFRDFPQRVSGFLGFKKTPEVVDFIEEWLNWCCDIRIISDLPNRCGFPNYKGFVRNHHEQTVLSLMLHRDGIPAYGHWDPMVMRHYFLKDGRRPGRDFNTLLKDAKKRNDLKKKAIIKKMNIKK